MEKKHSSFSVLKEEVIRALSPARSREKSPGRSESPLSIMLRRRRRSQGINSEPVISRCGTLGFIGETLTPLIEGPDADGGESMESKRSGSGIGKWMKGQLFRAPSVSYGSSAYNSNSIKQRSDLRLLIGVLGVPLAPMHVTINDSLPHLSIKDTPIETSSAQYILQQYIAASGGQKMQSSVRNAYAMGKLKMESCEFETTKGVMKKKTGGKVAESGGFILWQMNPNMWYVELAVGGSKVQAGCNGDLVWRHTPWLHGDTAKGPVRPLRRALQGLDPRTTAAIFSNAKCMGERRIDGEDCFILKLCADPRTVTARSEGPGGDQMIRHVMLGYFSQKTGLLIHIEDSHLTRIQSTDGEAVYWETTVNSILEDYRCVEGIMIAHSGHSMATLYRFGESAMSHTKSRMEECWRIEEVAFNVAGLSWECFIPPSDIMLEDR